ncbi:MAG: thioredoxin domain-containing protein [Peptococcaceae bacterium]|nr:thioredoxin domain-containing protein [Peptococcaceae bacterium]
MKDLTGEDFTQNVGQAEKKVIVKFYADWCPDCRRTAQGSQEIATEYSAKADFYQVNVDDERDLAARFDVKGIPSFLVFEQGSEVARLFSRDAKTNEQIAAFVRLQLE